MRNTSSLDAVASHLSTTPKWGNTTKCFPTALQVQANLPTCSSNCPCKNERQAGKPQIPILKSLVWPDLESDQSLQLLRLRSYHSAIRAVMFFAIQLKHTTFFKF